MKSCGVCFWSSSEEDPWVSLFNSDLNSELDDVGSSSSNQ